jgi:hypothetical protein
VVKRFFAVFGEPAIRQNINAVISLNGYFFNFSAARTIKEAGLGYISIVKIKMIRCAVG